jgi:sugar lactone lactonase YvrE
MKTSQSAVRNIISNLFEAGIMLNRMFATKAQAIAIVLALAAVPYAVGQSTQILSTVTTIAGNHMSGYTGDGGLATSATLAVSPTTGGFASVMGSSATMDEQGNIWIADSGNGVIRRVDASTGIITTAVGGATAVCAGADAAGDGCPSTQAILKGPTEVRFFRGALYIADAVDNRVRKVDLATGIVTTVLGTGVGNVGNLTQLNSNPALPATTVQVRAPQSIAFNTRGDMFVMQNGGQPVVIRVDAVTGTVSLFAGDGSAAGGKTGDGGSSIATGGSNPARFAGTKGIAVDSHGNVYIADTTNNCIRKVTVTSMTDTSGTLSTFAGPPGNFTKTPGVPSGFAGDGQTADNALFSSNGAIRLAFDAQDNLYVIDEYNNRIRRITQPAAGQQYGVITTVVGNGNSTDPHANDGQYALNADLVRPTDIQVTLAGDLLIVDQGIYSVRLAAPVNRFATTAVGTTAASQTIWAQTTAASGTFSVVGSTDFTAGATICAASSIVGGEVCSASVTMTPSLSGNRMAGVVFTDASGAKLTQPVFGTGLAPAASVLPGVISHTAGSASGAAGSSGDGGAAAAALVSAPGAVAVDAIGNIYVADTANDEVRRIAVSTGTITRVAGTAGQSGYTGDGGAATSATLNAPAGIAVDGAGNVYIADTGNNVVRRIDGVTGIITTIAGSDAAATLNGPTGLAVAPMGMLYIADTGNDVVRALGLRSAGSIQTFAGNGAPGFSGDGALAIAGQLTGPTALAVDGTGNVYISDTGNQRLREVATTGLLSTIAGIAVGGYSGDGVATSAELSSPGSIAVDAAGNVYVADSGNNRIRVIASGQITTVAGTGTASLSGDSGNSGIATLKAPAGLALDSANNLIVADTGNNSIRSIGVGASAIAFPDANPTTTSAPKSVSVLNSGNQALTVASVSVPASFAEQASGGTDCNTAALSLAAGASCILQLVFQPAALTSYSSSAVLTDNAQGVAGMTQTVALTGTGKDVFSFSFSLPTSVVAGSSQSITVTASNPSQTFTGTVHFTSSDPQAVLPADYTYLASENGVHTFTDVQLHTGGLQSITVANVADSGQNGTSTTTVTAGAAASVKVVAGSGQSTNIGTSFSGPLVAQMVDAYGNPVSGITVTFTAPAAGANASFAGSASTTAVSDSNGLATTTVTLTADNITGPFAVQASGPGLTAVSFALTNTSSVAADFTLTPYLTIVGTVLPGASSTQPITVTPVGGFSSTITFTCATSDPSTGCSVDPSSVPGTNGASQTVNLIFTTTGPSRTGTSALRGTSTVLVCLGLFFVAGCKRRRVLQAISLAMLCLVVSTSLSGCSSRSPYDPLSGSRTPSGSYYATVTATAGSISHQFVVQYVVAGD